MKQRRSVYLDIVKGLLIIMVVLAHCIQFGSGRMSYDEMRCLSDPVFKWIYGFHMPLFMLISGYLFWGSVSRHTIGKMVRSRLEKLLIPLISWQSIYLAILLLLGEISLTAWLLYSYPGALWFVWSVLVSSALVLAVHVLAKDAWWVFVAVWVMLLFVPANWLSGLHVFMYPYFVTGYLLNKWRGSRVYNLMNLRNKWLLLLFTLSAYMVLFYVYDTPCRSIYINGASLLGRDSMIEQCMIDMVRYVYGYLGIVMMLVGIDLSVHHYMPSVYKWEWLLWLGKNTLGIYIVNHYMNECLLRIDFTSNYFYSLTAVETILMLCAHSAIIVLLRKNNWSRRLLLGE